MENVVFRFVLNTKPLIVSHSDVDTFGKLLAVFPETPTSVPAAMLLDDRFKPTAVYNNRKIIIFS
jgi:hypothetical protein